MRPSKRHISLGMVMGMSGLIWGCGSPDTQETGLPKAGSDEQVKSDSGTPSPQVDIPFRRVTGPQEGEAQELMGKGGTFPVALYKLWFEKYSNRVGVKLKYEGVGSSEGIKRLINRQVDFGASDAPMTADEMRAAMLKGKDMQASGQDAHPMDGDILHIPTAFGGIAVVYNVPGISGQLRFTPQTLSGIYQGTITRWNDPALVRDNPQLRDTTESIIAIHRSDGSGTTYGFTDYLSTVSPTWAQRSGRGASVYWPQGIGVPKNDGVKTALTQNPYSIGYLELGYAQRNKLTYGSIQNRSGRFVEPSLPSIAAAAAAVGQSVPADLRFSSVNASGSDSYPLVTATWLLVYRHIPSKPHAVALTRLLEWAVTDAQAANPALNYAPVPAAITARSEALIREIGSGG